MSEVNLKTRLLMSSMIAGAMFVATATVPAVAQEDDAAVATTDAPEEAEARQQRITVTGSRILQPNLVTTSPVSSVSSEDIKLQGVTRVEDLVVQLPQAFAAQNSTVSNGASGTATVSLRNLGASRTLVLIDGKRMPYGSPNSVPADLNLIPGQLVERVDVLTGGASAVYGSDAVAGVVNFIMKTDFEGIQLDAQYGFFNHENDYDTNGNLRDVIAGRSATNPGQFRLPEDNVTDGISKEITAIMGVRTDDGRGNLVGYVSYRNNDEVLQANRDYSACAIGVASATGFTCGGSSTAFPGRVNNTFFGFGPGNEDINGEIPAPFDFTIDQATGALRPFNGALDQYNFGPLNYYQRPDERYSFGAFGRYEINPYVEAYTSLMFMDYSSIAQIAPSGNFFATETLNCDNPLFSADFAAAIGCDAAAIANGDVVNAFFGRRNVEGGGRRDNLGYQTYRGVVGLRGEFAGAPNWQYDVSGQFSQVTLSRAYTNEFSITRLNRALNVVTDPNSGLPVCASVLDGTDPNCVPYNIFNLNGVTPEALDYLQVPLVQSGTTSQNVVIASVTGDLTGYGLKSPAATEGLKVAAGIEYRRDAIEQVVDVTFATGDGAGQGGATLPLSGSIDAYDVFGEFQLPLASDRPGVQLLSLDGAARLSDYSTGISSESWKVGGEYAPTNDIRFRASFQKAVRAPNVIELFQSQGLNLFDIDQDPCGDAPTASLQQCVDTGVPSAIYGSAGLNSPAGQYNFLQGGNPDLEPEEADTFTIGFVATPSFLPGLTLSVDYYDIEITNLVTVFGAENVLNGCYGVNGAPLDTSQCAKINRNAGGSLWVNPEGFVVDLNTNIGGLATSGFDINAAYAFDLSAVGAAGIGGFALTYQGTIVDKLEEDLGNGQINDYLGTYGGVAGTPNPEYRHRARLNWQTPVEGLELNGTWRHIGAVDLFGSTATTRVDYTLDAQNYFDLAGIWAVKDWAAFRFGVNNVLDDDPPLSASVGTTGNGNTFPQTYDAMGRYVFVGLTLDF